MTERLPVGPVLVALGAVVGCLGGSRVVPAAVLLAVGAVGGAAVVFGPTRVVGVAVVVAIAGAAALASARAHDGVRRSALTEGVARGETVTLTGTAVDDADSGPFWAAVLVRVAAGSGHRTVLLRATGSEAMRLAPVRSGDHLVFGGRLGPLRTGGDHRARLRHAVARVEGSRLLALAPPSGLRAAVEALRARVLLGIERIAPTDHGLVAGFLLGETRAVPADVVAAYRAAGLSHLLAVSGANVAFVLAVVAPLLRRLGLGARTALALGVVVAFAVMTRGEPSVLRASALAAGSLVATAVGRPAARVRLLAYAVTALLLADPFLVRSPGFWLSVGASAGILVVAPALERRLPGSGVLRSALAVSIAAQVGVAPVLVMLAGSVPVAAPVANVLVAPVAELLGTAGLVLALLAGTFPVVGPVVAPFVGALVAWVSGTARVAASLPLALDRVGVAVVAAAVAAGASVACRRGSRAVPRAPAG